MGIFSTIFGSSKVIETGLKLIDDIHYSDSEEAEDKRKEATLKTNAKIELLKAYAPFKLTQRYLAFAFSGIFLFIMINGVLGSLYGFILLENVNNARDFANEMWLGEIVIAIIGFYFSGGFVESFNRKK